MTMSATTSWSGPSAMPGTDGNHPATLRSTEETMKRSLALLALGTQLALASSAVAQENVIKLGLALDFTKVYTFVSSEYNQGQRDYLSLINARGGIKGHRIEAAVVDHGNEPQRGIEAYER